MTGTGGLSASGGAATGVHGCQTIRSCLFGFRGASYMGYHNKELPTGSDYRGAQCMDRVDYNADGTIKRMVRTPK